MTKNLEGYLILIEDFIRGGLSVSAFQEAFFRTFKNEDVIFDEAAFQLLDELFGDLDAFTDNAELLRLNSVYYVDEATLRANVTEIQRLLNDQIRQDEAMLIPRSTGC